MIELIFVIVIIGILAAVAIPRLAATRDDAKVATSLSEVGMILREMSSYYTANGQYSDNPLDMSNITDLNLTSGTVQGDNAVFTYYSATNNGGVEKCVTYTVKNTDGNITIADAGGSHQNVCNGLVNSKTFKKIATTHKVGGSNVSF